MFKKQDCTIFIYLMILKCFVHSLNVRFLAVFCSFAIIMFGSFDIRMNAKNCVTNGYKWYRQNMHWKNHDYNYNYYKTISYINILNLNSFQITQQPFHCFTGTTFEHFWILYISFLHKYLVLTFNVDLTLNSLKFPKYSCKKDFHVDLNFRPYRPLTVPWHSFP